jgi:mono/diheme cytochrome c family protein
MLGALRASLFGLVLATACAAGSDQASTAAADASISADAGVADADGETDADGRADAELLDGATPTDAGPDAPDAPVDRYPARLSETGLYADLASDTLASGVEPFEPQFELWSDGARKRRWVKLPADAMIDTSDMDYWTYPVGTQLFKEFTSDGVRVETRMLEKTASGWVAIAYAWNEDGSDASAVPLGATDARGTQHDIPDQDACAACHSKLPDHVLGFSAVQLAHDGQGATLASLAASGRLSDPPGAPLLVPGDAAARAALGYLHANCGSCHNPRSFTAERVSLNLWLAAADLATVEATATYRTTVGVEPELVPPELPALIQPGRADESALLERMLTRDLEVGMPPLASAVVDELGTLGVRTWIDGLAEAPAAR